MTPQPSSNMEQVKTNPMYRFLMVMTIASMMGLQTWRTLFNNFAADVANLQGNHIGMIQSVREIPGFLAMFAIFIMLIMKEHRISALSIFVLGAGVAITGFFPSYAGIMMTTMIMSFGFHYYETTNQSLTLQYFDKDTSPWVIGKLRSYAAASNIVVGIIIFFLSVYFDYIYIYLILGGFIMCLGIWGSAQNPADETLPPQRKKMIFRKKYWLFYFLTFMGGARRQIFMAFAVFLLVKKFQFSVQEITLLFILNNILNFLINPVLGKAIIRFGERKILSVEYFSLIFIFLAYAYIDSKIIVAVFYIIDHVLFNFSIAIKTFFQKIADPRDIAPSMAVGFTINHIAAVIIPVVGGILWMVDYKIPFIGGAVLALVSLVASQFISSQIKRV